jgi:hypothetical protein
MTITDIVIKYFVIKGQISCSVSTSTSPILGFKGLLRRASIESIGLIGFIVLKSRSHYARCDVDC